MNTLAIVLSATALIIAIAAITALNRSVRTLTEKVSTPSSTVAQNHVTALPSSMPLQQDDALVAAITGALMAYMGNAAPKDGLIVRRITRVKPDAWINAGRTAQLQNNL